jgi:hypothetical protein
MVNETSLVVDLNLMKDCFGVLMVNEMSLVMDLKALDWDLKSVDSCVILHLTSWLFYFCRLLHC